ncbi:MAG TPA: ATP-binding protein, partial [Polyangiaceae bacterium]|nr:ATP-binding protein [Polyangiaceae bacterium]
MSTKLELERPFALALVEEFPRLSIWREQLKIGRRIDVSFDALRPEELAFLEQAYARAGGEYRNRAANVAALLAAVQSGEPRFGEHDDLERLLPALALYLSKDALRGWLFNANVAGKALAYVVYRLDYVPASSEEVGKILLELRAYGRGMMMTKSVRICSSDIVNKSVPEILASKGLLKETPALIAAYDAAAQRYFDWQSRYGSQFLAAGVGFYAEDPTSPRRESDWSRKDLIVLSTSGGPARVVNDEGILPAQAVAADATGDILGPYLRKAGKSDRYSSEDEVQASRAQIPAGLFTQIPVHGYLFVFHLELHHHLWVHVDDLAAYEYSPSLKQKLVLPPEQTDLIDILTAEMDVLMDDIVVGKSGGTTVLCSGPAGVGKTLTAEVYSEIVGRPLYRVHSGQLGLNVAAMEQALKEALTRAQRWGAVMLIDEADVYIKRREDDMTMNAVVGVFLRVLEYFNGLLFLTTNRVDDIDEAIVSRCIALLRYQPPDRAGRQKIWQVMNEQFELKLSSALIEELAELFPEASGRDIKGLAKLVAKYCRQKKVGPTLE